MQHNNHHRKGKDKRGTNAQPLCQCPLYQFPCAPLRLPLSGRLQSNFGPKNDIFGFNMGQVWSILVKLMGDATTVLIFTQQIIVGPIKSHVAQTLRVLPQK